MEVSNPFVSVKPGAVAAILAHLYGASEISPSGIIITTYNNKQANGKRQDKTTQLGLYFLKLISAIFSWAALF